MTLPMQRSRSVRRRGISKNDAQERFYGEDRLKAALDRLGGADPQVLLPAVKADVDAFVGDAPQFDDITMLALHCHGPQRPR